MSARRNFRVYRFVVVILPLVSVFISTVTTIAAYCVAYYKSKTEGHDEYIKFIPFISDLSDYRPESSVFSFGMTLSGCVTLLVIFIRYLQVKNFYVNRDMLNHVSLVFGVTLVVGKFMVVSFQLSSQIVVHFIGATLYFVGTFLYCIITTSISRNHGLRMIYKVRVVSCILMFLSGFFFALFLLPSLKREYHGYQFSEIAEWTFVVIKMIFLITFMWDLKEVVPEFGIRKTRVVCYETFKEDDYAVIGDSDMIGLESRI